jgi:hypothetical protein
MAERKFAEALHATGECLHAEMVRINKASKKVPITEKQRRPWLYLGALGGLIISTVYRACEQECGCKKPHVLDL